MAVTRFFAGDVVLSDTGRGQQDVAAAIIVGVCVLLASLFGIGTRSAGLLAAVWPANACLLGLLVRWPHLASPTGWASAIAGYVIADLVTGGNLLNTLILTAGNLVGVLVGRYLFMRLDEAHRQLRQPMSIVYFIGIVVAASASASLCGLIANPVILGRDPLLGLVFWFAGELVNYIAILPVLLTMPKLTMPRRDRRQRIRMSGIPLMKLAPAVALVLSCIFALYIGGPGAIAFPITALLWCALSYSLFTTAVLAFLFSTWTLSAIKLGLLSGWPDLDAQYALISIRLGVTLMSLAPIAVGSVVVARNELLERLEHLACHDGLTGLLNRRAFTERSEGRLAAAAQTAQVSTALMMDIDHFKRINDTYGHAAGDTVLKSFATVAQSCLREEDMIGRLGGEEFAALFVNCAPGEAAAVAERIRAAIADTVVPIDDGRTVPMTVSIGMAETKEISTSIEALLSAADKALYAAKTSGRNRVSVAA